MSIQQQIPFVDLVAQQAAIAGDIRAALESVLSRCNFIAGADVEEFETAFSSYIGVKHAIGVSSGLDALTLVLMALNIGSGDEVILPASTFIATALAVSCVGARPVLVDCDRETYNIDPAAVEAAITPRTRVLLPVHLTGQPAEMSAILDLADRNGLEVVEDAAQAHGARYGDRLCGSMGIAGCFSFYPSKNLGAYGDGGMITTNNDALADRLRSLRNYGQRAKYEHVIKGRNARLDTLQAAILGVKLRHLENWNAARRGHAKRYLDHLTHCGDIRLQQQLTNVTHVYHLFAIETEKREALSRYLSQAGIQTAVHYPKPIHLQEAYRDLGYRKGDFPNAEQHADHTLSFPMYPELTEEQISFITDCVRRFFAHANAAIA